MPQVLQPSDTALVRVYRTYAAARAVADIVRADCLDGAQQGF